MNNWNSDYVLIALFLFDGILFKHKLCEVFTEIGENLYCAVRQNFVQYAIVPVAVIYRIECDIDNLL